jgi:hypothetical protein
MPGVRICMGRRRGKNGKFWMDMAVIATRMIMMERTNLGKPKREQECPEQSNGKSLEPYPLFSEATHVTFPLLPLKQFFSLSVRVLVRDWMLAIAVCRSHTTKKLCR